MKIATFALALASLGAVTATALAQSRGDADSALSHAPATARTGDADRAFVSGATFSEPDGATLYKRVCASCHMPDAKGAVGAGFYPSLASNPKLESGGYPAYVVVKGMNGMPAIGEMMTDQQVADVVNYVRTHFGNKYRDKVTAADVKSVR